MAEPKSEDQLRREKQQMYRNVFGSPEGKMVLGDILTMGHFDVPLNADDPVRLGERSMAITIARMAGGFDALYQQLRMSQET